MAAITSDGTVTGSGVGGTRLKDRRDEIITAGENANGDDISTNNDKPQVQASDTPVRSAIGSGNVDLNIDGDTGRASYSISGSGGSDVPGNQTSDVGTEDDTTVATFDATTQTSSVEQVEQAVETQSGGVAYGDPNEVEDIGTGDAVREVTGNEFGNEPSGASTPGDASTGALPVDSLLVAAVLLVGGLLVVGGGA